MYGHITVTHSFIDDSFIHWFIDEYFDSFQFTSITSHSACLEFIALFLEDIVLEAYLLTII